MILHSKPFFTEDDRMALSSVLDKAFVTNGEIAKELGLEISRVMRKKWGVVVQSGTDALILSLKALNLKRYAKIAIPAYSCGAILDAVEFLGMTPEPVDISKDHLGVSPEIVSGTKYEAVIAAHLFGIAAPFFKIEHDKLIEDCAQCLGISNAGRRVGSMGRLSVSSLYGTKILSTGHGGVICGNDMASFKRTMDTLTHDKVDAWHPHLHFLMSDLNASLGLSQSKKLCSFISRRRQIAAEYLDALGAEIKVAANEMYFRFIVVPAKSSDISSLIAKFARAGIEAKKPVYKPIFKLMKLSARRFPNADWADKNLLSIPIYPAMTDQEVSKVADFLRRHKREIRCRASA